LVRLDLYNRVVFCELFMIAVLAAVTRPRAIGVYNPIKAF